MLLFGAPRRHRTACARAPAAPRPTQPPLQQGLMSSRTVHRRRFHHRHPSRLRRPRCRAARPPRPAPRPDRSPEQQAGGGPPVRLAALHITREPAGTSSRLRVHSRQPRERERTRPRSHPATRSPFNARSADNSPGTCRARKRPLNILRLTPLDPTPPRRRHGDGAAHGPLGRNERRAWRSATRPRRPILRCPRSHARSVDTATPRARHPDRTAPRAPALRVDARASASSRTRSAIR